MPADLLLQFQASTTRTAVGSQGSTYTLPGGTPRRGLKGRFVYSATNTSAGAGTLVLGVEASYDGGTTWSVAGAAPILTLSTTAAAGEAFAPFDISPQSVVNGTIVRASVITISGTGATTTYTTDLLLVRP